jgi:predicted DNA binding CopG/RHH family protein
MKKKIEYTDEPMGEIKIIEDIFPRPEELIFKEDDLEVTITISNQSIRFFKNQAKKHNTQYQNLIRNFLDEYVTQHQDK